MMAFALQGLNPSDPFVVYFTALGFEVTWDFSRREQVRWYEIHDADGLVAQIDMGIPLPRILVVLRAWHNGHETGTSDDDAVRSSSMKRIADLCAKVDTTEAGKL